MSPGPALTPGFKRGSLKADGSSDSSCKSFRSSSAAAAWNQPAEQLPCPQWGGDHRSQQHAQPGSTLSGQTNTPNHSLPWVNRCRRDEEGPGLCKCPVLQRPSRAAAGRAEGPLSTAPAPRQESNSTHVSQGCLVCS